ncbi:hypothetical protein [Ornithobacterium rhinotracheale]|uniref:hypothetical protein n=1 Tax=Ornithobacterium rhinotracheale TaxID=28251 RepID=UPI001FF32041|nr:hypothetical protein [Ornithobacterium rhinotracheale]MCK0194564.1 hypothetical protein [Ornithobacterium rhinotracheale]
MTPKSNCPASWRFSGHEISKPKSKVEFGELELVGVDIVENLNFEKYKDERLQINGLMLVQIYLLRKKY